MNVHVILGSFFLIRFQVGFKPCEEAMVSRSGDNPAWQDHLEGSSAGCHFLDFAHKVRDWWLETTDVVFLNSPWLRRSTGRGFRCLWILYISFKVLWCIEFMNGGIPYRLLNFVKFQPLWYQLSERFCFVFMLFAFGRVLWSSLMTSRDTISNSLLLAGASMTSFGLWAHSNIVERDWWIPAQNAFVTVFLGYTFPILCHCNVHPVVLPLLFAYTMWYTLNNFLSKDVFRLGVNVRGDLFILFHIIGFQFSIGYAFGLDFTNRVKAVATGMLHNADTFDPLESPVAGRSSRGFCWLVLLNNWVFMACFCYRSLDSSRYPGCMYILDTICLCLPWMVLLCTRSPNCTPFKFDVAFVSLSYAPPAWVLLRHNSYQKPDNSGYWEEYSQLRWFLGGMALACRSIFLATQAAIQAGCFPLVCLSGFICVTIIFVASVSMQRENYWFGQSSYAITLVISFATWPHIVLFQTQPNKRFADMLLGGLLDAELICCFSFCMYIIFGYIW